MKTAHHYPLKINLEDLDRGTHSVQQIARQNYYFVPIEPHVRHAASETHVQRLEKEAGQGIETILG